MIIYDYATTGGKNVITEYISHLPKQEQLIIYAIREEIRLHGLDSFSKLNTRQLRGKLWEIKVSQTRIMYVIRDRESVIFLHICKKQKGATVKKDIEIALKRAKEENLI